MEVDALLAKVTALKEFRGEKDEASDGQNPHHHDACGGRPQHQESLVGHSGPNREKELMVLEGNKGGKASKGGKGKGLWKIRSSFE